ncbi:hypothetical protein GYMLUDRAFT_54521 [Collybiopsis luxurians FD-317 M1]|nr:hypothetical protein GYMLUDRAFT_54521 [Collybiopsis luxurians FD-317 M1]
MWVVYSCVATRRSPRKTEKKPVYVLNLVIPLHQVDNLLEPAKGAFHFQNKTAVSEFLSSSILSFLVRHGFLVQADTSRMHENLGSPRKRKRLDFEHNSGYAEVISEENEDEITELPPPPLDLYAGNALDGDEAFWTDSNTGETFIVDLRTGNSRPQSQPRPEEIDDTRGYQMLRQRRTLSFPNSTDKSQREPAPEWIQEALEANDTYAISERRIAQVSVGSAKIQQHPDQHQQSQNHQCQIFSKSFLYGQGNGDLSGIVQQRFTKDDIRGARIISQVDRKFIACVFEKDLHNGDLMNSSSQKDAENSTLVLIDQASSSNNATRGSQHAADERIRVEQFLKEICLGFLRYGSDEEEEVERRHLTPPVPVLLTRLEASRLAGSQEIRRSFESWGIHFTGLAQVEAMDSTSNRLDKESSGYVQVSVERVPEVVADKLTMGNELRDLVKGYLAQLETDMPDVTQTSGLNVDSSDWLKALRWCPRELLDLVNSKACRGRILGAIMFNDPLTNEQCSRLVYQLSETIFPFQCAHGRFVAKFLPPPGSADSIGYQTLLGTPRQLGKTLRE